MTPQEEYQKVLDDRKIQWDIYKSIQQIMVYANKKHPNTTINIDGYNEWLRNR